MCSFAPTLNTSTRTDWRLQDPSATDAALQDIPIVGTDSDTTVDNGGTYAATDSGVSSIAVNVVEDNIYLKLDFGQGNGRLSSVSQVYPQWKSFQVYRKGDFMPRRCVTRAGEPHVPHFCGRQPDLLGSALQF